MLIAASGDLGQERILRRVIQLSGWALLCLPLAVCCYPQLGKDERAAQV